MAAKKVPISYARKTVKGMKGRNIEAKKKEERPARQPAHLRIILPYRPFTSFRTASFPPCFPVLAKETDFIFLLLPQEFGGSEMSRKGEALC